MRCPIVFLSITSFKLMLPIVLIGGVDSITKIGHKPPHPHPTPVIHQIYEKL